MMEFIDGMITGVWLILAISTLISVIIDIRRKR